jgi:hypothetical protein
LTTILVRKEQIQQSHLSEHVTLFNAWQMSHSPARMPGAMPFNYMSQLITGQKQGLAMLYGEVQSQATMISLNNIYRMLTTVMIIALLLTVLLPRPVGRAPAGAH